MDEDKKEKVKMAKIIKTNKQKTDKKALKTCLR